MRKTLRLRRETLVELGEVQLEVIAGGATSPTCGCTYTCWSIYYCPVPTLPYYECFRETSPCTS